MTTRRKFAQRSTGTKRECKRILITRGRFVATKFDLFFRTGERLGDDTQTAFGTFDRRFGR